MLTYKPLNASFGAEVFGVALDTAEAGAHAEELVRALHRHRLLLFSGQRLTVEAQLRVTSYFGRPTLPWDPTHGHADSPYAEVFESSPPRAYKRPAEHWHSDASFLSEPTDATLLYGVVAPAEGGRTQFNDARGPLAELPRRLRERVTGLRAVHDFGRNFSTLRQASSRVSQAEATAERAAFPPVTHPLVRPHPVTGEPALYLNEMCLDRIEGLPGAESRNLIEELYAHTLRPRWQYAHAWCPGDLLVWDNPSLLHRGENVPTGMRRLVHRTTARYRGRAL
ncbi:alpha-ketoglutarate-dependent taurine dioxygenase [Streptomyces sp. LBL]|uniref:TauD/TfdA dioxygenase family protein n=1 Tax=Streptomyces sp. LBL TaxID=2940562 RepID=UPI0024754BAB|nr:TauD/TfdA family dioxygenase [Streptomyces sp. LBL]MDH6623238.1 alpha-ketoglutarate-dependent taurine dioxygenase [Streptomyces sp. LBL]